MALKMTFPLISNYIYCKFGISGAKRFPTKKLQIYSGLIAGRFFF